VYEQLRGAPTEPASIERIARIARVARSTVYLLFGSRAGLFDALAADLLQRGGFDRVLQAVAHPNARETLRGGLRASTEFFAADRDVHRALQSMSALDAGASGGAVQRSDERRSGGMAHLAQRLSDQDLLRPDVSVGQAASLLWLLTSFDAFDLLYTGRGMSVEDVAAALITTAERSLCR
jgi:AcrR family transcriptional regulator